MKKIILEKSTLLTLLVTSSVFMGGTCVFAEEPVERFTLGEFVVTASRVATNKSDTPANISVITKESITDNNYSDAAEAISSRGQCSWQRSKRYKYGTGQNFD